MRRDYLFKACLTLLAVLGISVSAFAQQITVNGVVQDTQGEPIIGANILVKGTSNGTITDLDGNFQLTTDADATLVISFIGYQTQELPAQPVMNITLRDDTEQLDEVVVIGYGSVKKNDLSGSVVALKAEELNKGAVTSPQELIQGKVPGLHVSSPDGQPGAGSSIRIRGGASLNASNDPLIVIDGIPVANDAAPGTPNALATINPNDIETFTVLKDASATAIYGSRASNGVIIITTKKGSKSGGIHVSADFTASVSQNTKYVDVLTGDEMRDIMKWFAGEDGAAYAALGKENTDWQKEIFQLGKSMEGNVSLSGKVGGTRAFYMPYRVSVGYYNQDGTLKTGKLVRETVALSLTPTFFDEHLVVNLNGKGMNMDNQFANQDAIGGDRKPNFISSRKSAVKTA